MVGLSSNSKRCAQSPEKLQARMEEMAAAVDRERASVADAERQLRELHTRLDNISKVRHLVL